MSKYWNSNNLKSFKFVCKSFRTTTVESFDSNVQLALHVSLVFSTTTSLSILFQENVFDKPNNSW